MNIQDIEAFVALAEAGSVSRAAVRLNLTQPATTRRIQNFEQALGSASLFDRSVKPATLTTVGHHVLEHCRRVLSEITKLKTCTSESQDPSGIMRIGIAHGLGKIVLTSPFDALRRSFPNLKLQVNSNWSAQLIEEVRSGIVDCAIALVTPHHVLPEGIIPISLGVEPILVVSASIQMRHSLRRRCNLRDLSDQEWLLNPTGCGCRAALVKAFDSQQLPLQVSAEVMGEDLQLSLLARSRNGVALAPKRQFDASPHRRHLKILNVADFNLQAGIVLVRRRIPDRLDEVLRVLTEALVARL
jgi:DNA-binding transcriptional LysR family regulator